MRAKARFADADGMQPEDVAIRQRLLDARIVFAETLGKAGTPVAAPPHPPEIIRRSQREKNYEQDVVKCLHPMIEPATPLIFRNNTPRAKKMFRKCNFYIYKYKKKSNDEQSETLENLT